MPTLPATLRDQFENATSRDDRVALLTEARAKLASQADSSRALHQTNSDEMVVRERESLEEAYLSCDRLLDQAREALAGQQDPLAALVELDIRLENFLVARARLHDAGWATRGPSSHPGANELLALLEGLAEGDDRAHDLKAVVESEARKLPQQRKALDQLPAFLHQVREVSLDAYEELLQSLDAASTDEATDWDETIEELEDWATDYATFDLEFLTRRYSGPPTALPSVSFALNCQRLEMEEMVSGDMVDHAIDAARATLEKLSIALTLDQSLSEADQNQQQRLVDRIGTALDELPEAADPESLRDLGRTVANWVDGLLAIQTRATGQDSRS